LLRRKIQFVKPEIKIISMLESFRKMTLKKMKMVLAGTQKSLSLFLKLKQIVLLTAHKNQNYKLI